MQSDQALPRRVLGATSLEVSEIGLGTWQLGGSSAWGTMRESQSLTLIAKALDMGCNLFDTAPNYGQTRSEQLLGKALRRQRDRVVIVSKFGHRPEDDRSDFSVEWFWESLHQSLARLQTDYIDVFLAHSPPAEVLRREHPIWDCLRRARQAGKIRFYGASLDTAAEVATALTATHLDVLELLFNLVQQDVRKSFDLIARHRVGVLAKVPLDSGWLSGNYNAQSRFDGVRSRWSDEQISARAAVISDIQLLLDGRYALSQAALAFLLSYETVSSVIPGCRSPAQLEANIAAAGTRLPPALRQALEALWRQHTADGRNPFPW